MWEKSTIRSVAVGQGLLQLGHFGFLRPALAGEELGNDRPEARIEDQMGAVRPHRRIAPVQLVDALRAGLDAPETVAARRTGPPPAVFRSPVTPVRS